MKRGSSSLAATLPLTSVTAWLYKTLSNRALKAAMKLGCLGLTAQLTLMSVTTCMDVNLPKKVARP